jgi:ubiquitin C-terminal hydrolase
VETIIETDLIMYICIPDKQRVSLEQCIEYTYADESINKLNEKTNKQQTYVKHTSITKNPYILILQYNKRGVTVIAPDILNISPYSTIPDTYELFGIINHIGDESSGHYYTFIKESSGWVIYDDAIKKHITSIEPLNNYCMFYRKII